jgi:hypothetical protein
VLLLHLDHNVSILLVVQITVSMPIVSLTISDSVQPGSFHREIKIFRPMVPEPRVPMVLDPWVKIN